MTTPIIAHHTPANFCHTLGNCTTIGLAQKEKNKTVQQTKVTPVLVL